MQGIISNGCDLALMYPVLSTSSLRSIEIRENIQVYFIDLSVLLFNHGIKNKNPSVGITTDLGFKEHAQQRDVQLGITALVYLFLKMLIDYFHE